MYIRFVLVRLWTLLLSVMVFYAVDTDKQANMKNNQHGGELIAFRIPPEVLAELEAIVKGSGRTVSTWARTVVLEALAKTRFPVQVGPAVGTKSEVGQESPSVVRTKLHRAWGWALLSSDERSKEFGDRQAGGYRLPPEFESWERQAKLDWLDANWPIKEGE